MRKSLTKQIAMVFIGLMLLILFGNWLINSFFLEDYYVYKKQAQMVDSYEFLNGYQDSSSYATEDFLEELNVTCTENNIRVALLDSSFTVIYPGNEVGSILAATLETYLMQIDNSPKTILSTSDNYVIQKTQDRLMDREYMEIWGLLDNGCAFLLRMPLESIRENVRISSQFLLYFSILSILISVLLICWISARNTPVAAKMRSGSLAITSTACQRVWRRRFPN